MLIWSNGVQSSSWGEMPSLFENHPSLTPEMEQGHQRPVFVCPAQFPQTTTVRLHPVARLYLPGDYEVSVQLQTLGDTLIALGLRAAIFLAQTQRKLRSADTECGNVSFQLV